MDDGGALVEVGGALLEDGDGRGRRRRFVGNFGSVTVSFHFALRLRKF
jgi:hypothetical protein